MKLLNSILDFLKIVYNFLSGIFTKISLFFIKTLKISDFPEIDDSTNQSLLDKVEDFIEDFIDGNNYNYN